MKAAAYPVNALEGLSSEVAKLEQVSEQAAGRIRNGHRSGLGHTLQARSEIGCVADHSLLLGRAFAYEVADHHQPSHDADASRGARPQGSASERRR